ncbi:MAG: Hsp20/alpha crystallin family protein, partial [Zetaproteobacteria bacterium]|nr:Hsp20/alpha crystallin family protein [Zetaproteobacteria bacterium]
MLVKTNNRFPAYRNVFDDLFNDWSVSNFSETDTTLPAINIKENESGFFVEMAAPGMEKKDFVINLKDDLLTISSEKKIENEENNDHYTRKEYSYQSFSRSFSLPKNVVDSDKINATY